MRDSFAAVADLTANREQKTAAAFHVVIDKVKGGDEEEEEV